MYVLIRWSHDAKPSSLGEILLVSRDKEEVKKQWEGRSIIQGFVLKSNHCPSKGDFLFPHQVKEELNALEFVYG